MTRPYHAAKRMALRGFLDALELHGGDYDATIHVHAGVVHLTVQFIYDRATWSSWKEDAAVSFETDENHAHAVAFKRACECITKLQWKRNMGGVPI